MLGLLVNVVHFGFTLYVDVTIEYYNNILPQKHILPQTTHLTTTKTSYPKKHILPQHKHLTTKKQMLLQNHITTKTHLTTNLTTKTHLTTNLTTKAHLTTKHILPHFYILYGTKCNSTFRKCVIFSIRAFWIFGCLKNVKPPSFQITSFLFLSYFFLWIQKKVFFSELVNLFYSIRFRFMQFVLLIQTKIICSISLRPISDEYFIPIVLASYLFVRYHVFIVLDIHYIIIILHLLSQVIQFNPTTFDISERATAIINRYLILK